MTAAKILRVSIGCALVSTLSGGRVWGTADNDVSVAVSLRGAGDMSAEKEIAVETEMGEVLDGRVIVGRNVAGFDGTAKCRTAPQEDVHCILQDSSGQRIGIVTGRRKGSSAWGKVELDDGQLIPWSWAGDRE